MRRLISQGAFTLALLSASAISTKLSIHQAEKETMVEDNKSEDIAKNLQMLDDILSQFTDSLNKLMPALMKSGIEGDSADPQIVYKSFIGPKEVTIGDARMFIFGDFVGRQAAKKEAELDKSQASETSSQEEESVLDEGEGLNLCQVEFDPYGYMPAHFKQM